MPTTSKRTILIAGASGAIGRPLSSRLVSLGHRVIGVHRSPSSAALLRELGAEPLALDVFDETAIARAFDELRPDIVIHQLTALPGTPSPKEMARAGALTADLRRITGPLFAQQSARIGARFIAQSMSFITRPSGGAIEPDIVDESAPIWLDAPKPLGTTNRAIHTLEEATLRASGLVLRYGFYYGPGTWYARDAAIAKMIEARKMPIIGSGAGLFSFIHIDDAVDATVRAIDRGASGIYNITDDEPVPQKIWLPELACILGAPPPRRLPAWLVGLVGGPTIKFYGTSLRGASNQKAKDALGIKPRSWRDGFAEEFG